MASKGRIAEVFLGLILLYVTYINFHAAIRLASAMTIPSYIKLVSFISPLIGILASIPILKNGLIGKDQSTEVKALLLGSGILAIVLSMIINMAAMKMASLHVIG